MDQSFRTATSRPSWCSCVECTPSSFLHHPTTNFPPFTRLTLLPKGQRLQLSTDSRPIWVLTAGSRYMNGIIFLNSQPLKHHEDQIQKTTTSLFHLKCHVLLLHKICTKSPVLILCLSTAITTRPPSMELFSNQVLTSACSPSSSPRTQAGLWWIFHLFAQNRKTEGNRMKVP